MPSLSKFRCKVRPTSATGKGQLSNVGALRHVAVRGRGLQEDAVGSELPEGSGHRRRGADRRLCGVWRHVVRSSEPVRLRRTCGDRPRLPQARPRPRLRTRGYPPVRRTRRNSGLCRNRQTLLPVVRVQEAVHAQLLAERACLSGVAVRPLISRPRSNAGYCKICLTFCNIYLT